MKKYTKELIILLFQILIFYIIPIFSIPPMQMVLFILISTLILSIVLGSISTSKTKYIYPIVISILFIPSVYIYYNESALVHSLWYLFVSYIGIIIGSLINKI